MSILFKFSLICLVVLGASPGWGSEDQPAQISDRWSSWFSGQDLQARPRPAETAVYQADFTPTFYTPPVAPASVRDLSPDIDRPRTRGVLASTTWLKGALSTETEVAANQGGALNPPGNLSGDRGDDPSTRMMRLGLAGTSGALRYGISYRNAGHAFYNGGDQNLREAWGEWKSGMTTIRSAVGYQWNNVGGDPARARVEQDYGRIGLSWNKSAWPDFDVTYSKNTFYSTLDPLGLVPQYKDSQTVEAALGYTAAVWNARLASSYSLETDLLRHGGNRVKSQSMTASFHPLDALTIAPTLGYRAEQQAWSGVRIDSPSVSLAMKYRQSERLLISALGNYSETRSSDRLIELEHVGGKGVVSWDVQQSRHWTAMLSVEGGYNRQINLVTPSAQMEDLSGLLRLSLAPL